MTDTPRDERRKPTMTRIYLALTFAMAMVHAGCSADTHTANSASPDSPSNASALKPGMKITFLLSKYPTIVVC